jgi:hypothetical protein
VKRRLVLVGLAAVVALIGVSVGTVNRTTPASPPSPSFPTLRQSRVEEVPGTFGLVLKPPPPGFDPIVSPVQALQIASQGQTAPGPVFLTLASVPGMYTGQTTDTPMWVIIVRNLCYPSQKGELVSSSRRNPKNRVSNCSMRNLWVQVENPTTGKRISVVSGFDPTASWQPTLGST